MFCTISSKQVANQRREYAQIHAYMHTATASEYVPRASEQASDREASGEQRMK